MSKQLRKNTKSESQAPGFLPARMIHVELSRQIPDLDAASSATGHPYERGYVLARLHSEPVGIFEMKLGKDRVTAGEFAAVIWEELESAIAKHLEQDGITAVDRLPEKGIRAAATPVCRRNRIRAQRIAAPVSVVVATHDRPAGLDRCLRSLLRQDYPNFEILVVDNAPSTDAAVELIRKRYGSSVKVRYLREEYPGLAAAHNRGLKDVQGEIVAFTDDDVVADEHWLTALVGAFAQADDVACVTGMIFPAELETSAQGWIEQFGGFGKGISRRIFNLSSNVTADPLYPYTAGTFGSGANMAFRTSVLRGLGGFDPALGAGSRGIGGDDLAAFFEVVTRGYSLVYEPAALVHHWHRREYEGLRKQAYGYGVGLTAYLTKTVLDRPSRVFELARRVPGGMKHIFSSGSAKNRGKLSDYPKELTRMERKGMLQGPFAYMSSRRQAKKMGKYIRYEREDSKMTLALSGAGSEALRV